MSIDATAAPPRSPTVGGARGVGASSGPADGRSTRWTAHRLARREQLVGAALKAISRHGPGVGMDEIAAVAGTSKTVLYRHFADKDQLHLAVADRVDARVWAALRSAVVDARDFRGGLRAAIGAYLHLVQSDPAVYRFVVHHRATGPGAALDPVAGLSAAVSAELAALIDRHLVGGATGPGSTGSGGAAAAWGHGLVGMVRAAADHWQAAGGAAGSTTTGSTSADELADHLTDLVWGGLGTITTSEGIPR